MLLAADSPDALLEAASRLDDGQLVVLPGDAQYVLAADALDEAAVERVFVAKNRGADVPLPVAIATPEDVHHVAFATPLARTLAERLWPGPTLLVMRARPWLPDALTAAGGTVAVACPRTGFARDLARRFGPYVSTGAHRVGSPRAGTAAAARAALGGEVGLYVDGGPLEPAAATVVDATGAEARVLREGVLRASEVLSLGQ